MKKRHKSNKHNNDKVVTTKRQKCDKNDKNATKQRQKRKIIYFHNVSFICAKTINNFLSCLRTHQAKTGISKQTLF